MKRGIIIALIALMMIPLASCSKTEHDISEYVLEYDIGDKEDFKILQLSDIHIAAKDDRQRQFDFIAKTVNSDSEVDMIVVSGDLFTFADRKTAKELFNCLDSFNVPWTVTWGNHDEQCYFSMEWVCKYLSSNGNGKLNNCLFKDIPNDNVTGYANFAINLMKNNSLFEQVIIMDSNRYQYGKYIGYDYIHQDQIDWYKDLIDYTKNKYGEYESVMFFHIPLPEWNDAFELAEANDPSVEVVNPGYKKGEDPSSPLEDLGFFSVIEEKGSTKVIGVGHDHVNNAIIKYKGVYLSYCVNTTDRIYFDPDLLGGRTITISSSHTYSFADITNEY